MPYETKPNTGSLFPNDRKQTDSHPDFSGTVNIDGREYWISAWKKLSDGKARLSLSFKPKDQQQSRDSASSYRAASTGGGPPKGLYEAPIPSSEDEYGADPFGGFR